MSSDLHRFREHWRADLIAGFSVALVALPLSLGIAMGAGVPPISGVLSAIIGGLLTTFLRGSHVAINGPGNSLIVILATTLAAFGGDAQAFPHVLGVVVVSGALQVLLGCVHAGKLAQATPTAVIQGLLSAIGLIIVGKQLHVVLGEQADARAPLEVFGELPATLAEINPFVALIGVLSVLVLVIHPRIDNALVRNVPAPLWVVLLSVPMVFVFNHLQPHARALLGDSHAIGPELLVSIPDNLRASLVRPDFSRIGELRFWTSVMLVTVVTSIENVVSVKAVDKLDPERRESKLDRDLSAMGLSTLAAGLLGALPVLTVVARSSVNVNQGARTSWSNFYHGAFVLLFVAVLSPVIQELPLSALAGILVYTGYRLCAPKVVRAVFDKGPDHLLVFVITVLSTLAWGLLWGVLIGMLAELTTQLVLLRLPLRQSLPKMWAARFDTSADTQEDVALLRVDGIANFPNVGRMRAAINGAPPGRDLVVDFSRALLVDTTLLECCHEHAQRLSRETPPRRFEQTGLEAHDTLCAHPEALRLLNRPLRAFRLTPRQRQLSELAERRGWPFSARRIWEPHDFDRFHFFRAHPLEYRDTTIDGRFSHNGGELEFRLCDLTFDEGRLLPRVYHTTALLLRPQAVLPRFMLEGQGGLRRVVRPRLSRAIDLGRPGNREGRYTLYGSDPAAVRALLEGALIALIESRERPYHLESNGRDLLVFRGLRPASVNEIEQMLEFGDQLASLLLQREAARRASASSAPPARPKRQAGGRA